MKSLAYAEFKKGQYHYTLPKKLRRVSRVWINGKLLKKKYWRVFNVCELDLDYFGKGKKLQIEYSK